VASPDRPASRETLPPDPPGGFGEHRPGPMQRVTLSDSCGFFLVVFVGILAGCCVEWIDAVQAVVDTFPWHRDR
jgi:hypothetical protein